MRDLNFAASHATFDEVKHRLITSAAGDQWRRLGVKNRHGISVALSSLHTSETEGIGSFFDLIPLIDWCAATGLEVIQLLPLNDSGRDPSPYSAITAYGLHPLYLSLSHLPGIESIDEIKAERIALSQLTAEVRVPYHRVAAHKEAILFHYLKREARHFLENPRYEEFLVENEWIHGYALFKVLQEEHGDKNWSEWPQEHQAPSPITLSHLFEGYAAKMVPHSLLQYLAALQLSEVRHYAEKKGVLLMGDIPILISNHSADAWLHPNYFDPNYTVGAPPDHYSAVGQNWGALPYRWKMLEEDGYKWWRERLRFAERFYHIYRIDHVVGFFRLWTIPAGQSGLHGSYAPAGMVNWLALGVALLEMMLTSTTMLPIAEDLGSVPDEVRRTLLNMGICGTRVMRWERDYESAGSFISLNDYPPATMTCVSTHDSEGLKLWWTVSPEDSQALSKIKGWTWAPYLSRDHLKALLYDSHHTKSLFHINPLQEYLALFPELVSHNPADERINVPGTVAETNWTYRFRPSIEEIANHPDLSGMIREILT